MFRSFLCLVAAASLAACGGPGTVASAGSAPADTSASPLPPPPAYVTPLGDTQIDDKAIIVAFDALDAAATAVDALILAKVIKPGTPSALKIADGLNGARMWLNIASRAQQAAQADNYFTAMVQASAALAGVRAALKGN